MRHSDILSAMRPELPIEFGFRRAPLHPELDVQQSLGYGSGPLVPKVKRTNTGGGDEEKEEEKKEEKDEEKEQKAEGERKNELNLC